MRKLYPSKDYIPLSILNKETDIYRLSYLDIVNVHVNKSEMFVPDNFKHYSETITIRTPREKYICNDYILYNELSGDLLVVVCKKNDSVAQINSSIPDKSEWIVFRNSEKELILSGRFIKHYLGIKRSQTKYVTDKEMDSLFARQISVTMQMYKNQKEISSHFLEEYKNQLAI